MNRCWRAGWLLAGWVLMGGCATLRVSEQLDRALVNADYAGGLAILEKEKTQYAGPHSLLYYLDLGSLRQRQGDYAASNQALEQAERLIDELYTKSIGESAASFLVNDLTLSYSGEDFEQVMVHVLKALNYLYLEDMSGAQVEARKVNQRLLTLSDQYGSEAIYKEDAFARYLSAFAYEAAGEYNSAYIDYKKAYAGFQWYEKHFGMPMPAWIAGDLLRLSRWMGFDDEYERWRETFGTVWPEPSKRPKPSSEVLLVVYDGLMPAKKTRFVDAPITDADGRPYLLKVAFPAFRPREPVVDTAALVTETNEVFAGAVVEPLADIALQNLEQRIGLITAKAIARATAKYIAAVQVRRAARNGGGGVGLLADLATNIYTFATEQADTRSWRTLPNRFFLVRMPLPPGTHTLQVQATLRNGSTETSEPFTVSLRPGEKTALPYYIAR